MARLIDANLDRAREGLRVVEDWCRFGLEREDLVVTLKDWRQRLGQRHHDLYKQSRSTATDSGAGLGHPAQLDRHSPRQVVAANCARVQEALRVLEEFGRSVDPGLAGEAATVRYGLYDLEVSCLDATQGGQRRSRLQDCHLCLITSPCEDLLDRVAIALSHGVAMVQFRQKDGGDHERLTLATALRQLCNQHGALFIVNDRIDLALAVDADGVQSSTISQPKSPDACSDLSGCWAQHPQPEQVRKPTRTRTWDSTGARRRELERAQSAASWSVRKDAGTNRCSPSEYQRLQSGCAESEGLPACGCDRSDHGGCRSRAGSP